MQKILMGVAAFIMLFNISAFADNFNEDMDILESANEDSSVNQNGFFNKKEANLVLPKNGTTYGGIYGYSFRKDWGSMMGLNQLTLNTCMVNKNSKVFVSISEVSSVGTPFIGAAKYTLHNVAPDNCKVTIWVNVDWSTPLPLLANYLIVP